MRGGIRLALFQLSEDEFCIGRDLIEANKTRKFRIKSCNSGFGGFNSEAQFCEKPTA